MTGINQIFQMGIQNPRFLTLWYGIYCQSEQTLTYASAGHPPAILLTPNGKIQHIGQSGQVPIGMFTSSVEVSITVESASLSKSGFWRWAFESEPLELT